MKRFPTSILLLLSLLVFSPAARIPLPEGFAVSEVPDSVRCVMLGKSYKDDCTVPFDSLRYITVLHRNLEGETLSGEIVCAASIASDLIEIFAELYKASYPIERISLVDNYNADDEASMRDNNSSCFNFRRVSGTVVLSRHSLGTAIDINPLYNPYVKRGKDGIVRFEPSTAGDYIDRSGTFPYKIEPDDLCVKLFKAHGFTWGGDWTTLKDYQHFEK